MSCDVEPDTTNQCNSLNDLYSIPGFCTSYDSVFGEPKDSNIKYRESYCTSLGQTGEWGVSSSNNGATGDCSYNTKNPWQTCPNPNVGNCSCNNNGNKVSCVRKSFSGLQAPCCLKDNNCDPLNLTSTSPNSCFSDSAKKNTCPGGAGSGSGKIGSLPNYRSIISNDCRDVLLSYCSGTASGDQYSSNDWIERYYGEYNCLDAIKKNLYQIQNSNGKTTCPNLELEEILPISSNGFFWAQSLLRKVFTHYIDNGFKIGALPGQKGYNNFQNMLYNICEKYPGLCQDSLTSICSPYTSQQLSLNPSLNSWCGCHMNLAQYQPYSTRYNIGAQCTPNCNRTGTIPIAGNDGKAILCEQNICIIDNVNVNLMKSSGTSNLNFANICGYCPSGNCSCLVSDIDIKAVNTIFNDSNIDINQVCGATTCKIPNERSSFGPSEIPTNCLVGDNPMEIYEDQFIIAEQSALKKYMIWIFAILLIILGFFLIFWFFKKPRYRKKVNDLKKSLNNLPSSNIKNNLPTSNIKNNLPKSTNTIPYDYLRPYGLQPYDVEITYSNN